MKHFSRRCGATTGLLDACQALPSLATAKRRDQHLIATANKPLVAVRGSLRRSGALHDRTPLQAYSARIKARPESYRDTAATATHFRVHEDKVDQTGKVTIRHESRLHHIGIGRAHKGRQIKLLITDRNTRIIDPENGELLRALTLDPTRDYQPQPHA
jgi:hypothetical protein